MLDVACAAGLAPRIVHCDTAARLLVTEWIDGTGGRSPLPRAQAFAAVARTLARLHGIAAPPDLRVLDFARQARELEGGLPH